MKPWETLNSQTVFESRWIRVHKDKVRVENGCVIDDYYTVDVANAAAVVAVDRKGNIILKEEYRYGAGRSLIEIPAGMFEPDETEAESVARRELLEETGYTSDNWIDMGVSIADPTRLTNYIRIFLALDCDRVAEPARDEAEVMRVLRISMDSAVEMVMNGEIIGAITAHAILKANRIIEMNKEINVSI